MAKSRGPLLYFSHLLFLPTLLMIDSCGFGRISIFMYTKQKRDQNINGSQKFKDVLLQAATCSRLEHNTLRSDTPHPVINGFAANVIVPL